jgi:hypothetical protein
MPRKICTVHVVSEFMILRKTKQVLKKSLKCFRLFSVSGTLIWDLVRVVLKLVFKNAGLFLDHMASGPGLGSSTFSSC